MPPSGNNKVKKLVFSNPGWPVKILVIYLSLGTCPWLLVWKWGLCYVLTLKNEVLNNVSCWKIVKRPICWKSFWVLKDTKENVCIVFNPACCGPSVCMSMRENCLLASISSFLPFCYCLLSKFFSWHETSHFNCPIQSAKLQSCNSTK